MNTLTKNKRKRNNVLPVSRTATLQTEDWKGVVPVSDGRGPYPYASAKEGVSKRVAPGYQDDAEF